MANWVLVTGKEWININRREGEGRYVAFTKHVLVREGDEPFIITESPTSCIFNHGVKVGTQVLVAGGLGVICHSCIRKGLSPIRSVYQAEMNHSIYYANVILKDETR